MKRDFETGVVPVSKS